MKFKLESIPPGIVVCHIMKPLMQSEAAQIVVGIEKMLANGRARVILDFSAEASAGEGGADVLEKSLRRHVNLARKMGGDIKFVIPFPEGEKIFGAFDSLELAKRAMIGTPVDMVQEREGLLAHISSLQSENEQLKSEKIRWIEKLDELMRRVGTPSTSDALKKALEHYQALAAEAEVDSAPTSGASKS